MSLPALAPELSQVLSDLVIDDALSARLARWSPLGQAALINLTRTLALGTNKFRELAEWSDEIAQRDGQDPSAVLSDPDLLDILGNVKQSAPLRYKDARAYLFAQRFPELSRIKGQIDALIAEAKLPNDVSVQLPENLERNEIKVQFTVRTAADFKARLDKLAQLDVERMLACLSNPS